MNKPDHYLETEHLQQLKDDINFIYWCQELYGFRDGTVDDRTGEIWCPAREDYIDMLQTYNSHGYNLSAPNR